MQSALEAIVLISDLVAEPGAPVQTIGRVFRVADLPFDLVVLTTKPCASGAGLVAAQLANWSEVAVEVLAAASKTD